MAVASCGAGGLNLWIMRPADLILIAEARKAAVDGTAARARQAARLTQAEVGKACGVSGATVALWETGQRSPRTEAALAYGRLLRELAAMTAGAVAAGGLTRAAWCYSSRRRAWPSSVRRHEPSGPGDMRGGSLRAACRSAS